MRPRRPELRHRPPDRHVFGRRLPVHEAGVRDFSLGRALREVDFAVREPRELQEPQSFRQRVHARVSQERDAVVVRRGHARVVLERLAAESGKVVAFVEVFEHGRGGGGVDVGEVDLLVGGGLVAEDLGEVRGLREEEPVSGEYGGVVCFADAELDDW